VKATKFKALENHLLTGHNIKRKPNIPTYPSNIYYYSPSTMPIRSKPYKKAQKKRLVIDRSIDVSLPLTPHHLNLITAFPHTNLQFDRPSLNPTPFSFETKLTLHVAMEKFFPQKKTPVTYPPCEGRHDPQHD
jgi:hypothetical protein